jgi:hypothetical protein
MDIIYRLKNTSEGRYYDPLHGTTVNKPALALLIFMAIPVICAETLAILELVILFT